MEFLSAEEMACGGKLTKTTEPQPGGKERASVCLFHPLSDLEEPKPYPSPEHIQP